MKLQLEASIRTSYKSLINKVHRTAAYVLEFQIQVRDSHSQALKIMYTFGLVNTEIKQRESTTTRIQKACIPNTKRRRLTSLQGFQQCLAVLQSSEVQEYLRNSVQFGHQIINHILLELYYLHKQKNRKYNIIYLSWSIYSQNTNRSTGWSVVSSNQTIYPAIISLMYRASIADRDINSSLVVHTSLFLLRHIGV